MHIITQLASGQGIEQGGWRWPGEDAAAFINEDVYIKAAQLAEKAKPDDFFLTDFCGAGSAYPAKKRFTANRIYRLHASGTFRTALPEWLSGTKTKASSAIL